jgi:hypothetical protein
VLPGGAGIQQDLTLGPELALEAGDKGQRIGRQNALGARRGARDLDFVIDRVSRHQAKVY